MRNFEVQNVAAQARWLAAARGADDLNNTGQVYQPLIYYLMNMVKLIAKQMQEIHIITTI